MATGVAFIAIRFASHTSVDLPTVARQVIGRVGYEKSTFDARTCSVMTSINELPDGHHADVDENDMSDEEIARMSASHLVTVFGYACNHTPVLLPLPDLAIAQIGPMPSDRSPGGNATLLDTGWYRASGRRVPRPQAKSDPQRDRGYRARPPPSHWTPQGLRAISGAM